MSRVNKEKRIEMMMRRTNKTGTIVNPDLGYCWEWLGAKKEGYGLYCKTTTHRMSYTLFKGEIPKNSVVMHICDNRACLNPDHLKLGSIQDNINDKVEKGRTRGRTLRGENLSFSKLTNENVREIRDNPHDKCLNCLSRQFNVCPQQINRIQHNERWTELTEKENYNDLFWKRAVYKKILIHEHLGDCWETERDRQMFSYYDKKIVAHRISYIITYGEIEDGKLVRHKCDNSKCINPAHLELGTHSENMKDMFERGRTVKGESHYSAILNDEKALEIFNSQGIKSLGELSKEYNVSKTSISRIWKKLSWKHIHN